MSVQQLKRELAALSDSEREVVAYLFHLKHSSDSDYQADVERRLNDKDSSHWLSIEEAEKRLNQKN